MVDITEDNIVAFGNTWPRAKLQPKWGNNVAGVLYGDPQALHIILFCTGTEYHASLYYAEELPLECGTVGSAADAVRTLEAETKKRHEYIAPLLSTPGAVTQMRCVVVNGKKLETPQKLLTYNDVVALARLYGNPTVTDNSLKKTMKSGDVVTVVEGMVFNVAHTDNA